MKKTAFLIGSAAAVAFANGAAATETVKKSSGAPKAEDRVAPTFTEVRADVALPSGVKRGQKSELAIKLENLGEPVNGVPYSIGLTNKTKKQISSTISKLNNAADNQRQKTDANGAPMTKAGDPIKDVHGNIVSNGPAVPVMEKIKEFVAHDVNPKNDPDKATVRIFRVK